VIGLRRLKTRSTAIDVRVTKEISVKNGSYSTAKVDKKEHDASPPAQETDSHKGGAKLGEKFAGGTPGNDNIPIDRSDKGGEGGKGRGVMTAEGKQEAHTLSPSKSPFLGPTKGNKDLPPNRTSGVDSHEGGRYIASNDRYHGGRKMSPGGN
jgi:hypothetical protein